MKLRMAAPAHLVDLQGIAALRGIEAGDRVRIGAMVTQSEMIAHAGLGEATRQIADPQVRNLGTVGGNVANGDPGNDLPALMLCLDATFTLEGRRGCTRARRAASTRRSM